MATVELTGYGRRALDGGPFVVAQTAERIGRKVPTVAARAVAYAQGGDWSALRKLWNRCTNLHVSTGGGQGLLSIGYGSARLVEVNDARFWSGMGGGAALSLLEAEAQS